jgi:hypothetical protein
VIVKDIVLIQVVSSLNMKRVSAMYRYDKLSLHTKYEAVNHKCA